MQYLCNKHDLAEFYPRDPAQRAMVDSAMFYLIGTLYPLVARATYPALSFPQYPGEVGTSDADDAMKAKAQQDAMAAIAEPLDVYRSFYLDGKQFIGGASPASPTSAWPRRSSSCRPSTTSSRTGPRPTWPRWSRRSERVLRAGSRRARLHRLRQVTGLSLAVRG